MTRLKRVMTHPVTWFAMVIALILATGFAWDHQFEAVPGEPTLRLSGPTSKAFEVTRGADLVTRRPDSLELRASDRSTLPTVEVNLSRFESALGVMIDYSVSGDSIELGAKPWQRARLVALWRDASGEIIPYVPLIFGSEGTFGPVSQCGVLDLHKVAGTPSIILQNLARSGTFRVERCEVTPVQTRRGMALWFAALAALWLLWLAGAIHRFMLPVGHPIRVLAATLGVAAVAAYLVFPGPWMPLRPIGSHFELGPNPPSAATPTLPSRPNSTTQRTPTPKTSPPAPNISPSEPAPKQLVEPPEPSTFTSRFFNLSKTIRLIIHAGTYVGLAFLLQVLLSSRRAWLLPALIGVGAEVMQAAFGFGFDLLDLLDLLLDAAGIFAGIRLARWCQHMVASQLRRAPAA